MHTKQKQKHTVVKQRNKYDCGICALAMYTNKNYNEILSAWPTDPRHAKKGVESHETLAYLAINNFNYGYVTTKKFTEVMFDSKASEYLTLTNEQLKELLKGRKAILTLLTKSNGLHAVYCEDNKIYDPSPLVSETLTIDDVDVLDVIFEHK